MLLSASIVLVIRGMLQLSLSREYSPSFGRINKSSRVHPWERVLAWFLKQQD